MAQKTSLMRAKTIIYKCFVYAVMFFILSTMQVTFFSKINVLNATPDLMLGAVLVIALKDDIHVSSICGIISGFFYCVMGGFSYPFYMIFSFLCGYTLWIVSDRLFGKNYLSYLALALIAYGLKALFNILEISLFAQSFNLIETFSKVVLPEFISSMAFCTVSYIIYSAISRLMNKNSKSRKDGLKNERF